MICTPGSSSIRCSPTTTRSPPRWPQPNIWECPNLALIDGRWVLLISLWRWVDGTHQLSGVRYLMGDLVRHAGGLRFGRRPAACWMRDPLSMRRS